MHLTVVEQEGDKAHSTINPPRSCSYIGKLNDVGRVTGMITLRMEVLIFHDQSRQKQSLMQNAIPLSLFYNSALDPPASCVIPNVVHGGFSVRN